MSAALLSGIALLDLSRLPPGPFASWHLASLGARVVKIEPPDGDYARQIGPRDGERSYFYRQLNQGKDILSLDPQQERQRCAFLERVVQADLALESFRPGVLERMGLGFDTLQAVNARICLVSVTGCGRVDPKANKAGHDLSYLAISGWVHELIAGQVAPGVPNVQIADVLGGTLMAAFAAASALLAAARTGTGSHLTVSMTDAMIASNLLRLAHAQAEGQPAAPREDQLNGGAPCYGLYRTSDDRYVTVEDLEAKLWQRRCDRLDRLDLASRHWQSGQQIGGADA